MQNPAAQIQCSNLNCKELNPQNKKFCQQCNTPIIKRYLWAIGEGIEASLVGDYIGDRYLLVDSRLLLDTKPTERPTMPEDIPQAIAPYLKLSGYRLHIPRVYGELQGENINSSEIWLLEYDGIVTKERDQSEEIRLLPKIDTVWQEATALRQLNWLWQIASLWQPLHRQKVVSSLLNPSLLIVDRSIVKLQELRSDGDETISLKNLGQLWRKWADGSSQTIKEFLTKLIERLETGEIAEAREAIAYLELAMQKVGQSQQRTYSTFTQTHSGPTRDNNEDACYPSTNTEAISKMSEDNPIAIVCDGIGGQEGGEIASQMAIDFLGDNLAKIHPDSETWNPIEIQQQLATLTCDANDTISSRNDREQRYNRERMGTTLVMSFAHGHEVYLTHVGDSRIYWITPSNCHQVTVDDDLASRQVRLGYALYRDANNYPQAGALVQALGMNSSTTLYPTVQRLIIDEDSILLLCSDGLSDCDRVEQYWENEILPILEGTTDLATVGKQLIEIANEKNGHDNVTVALVHCQVEPTKAETAATALSWSEIELGVEPLLISQGDRTAGIATDTPSPDPADSSKEKNWKLLFLLTTIFILIIGGLLTFKLKEEIKRKDELLNSPNSQSSSNLVVSLGDENKIVDS